MKRALVFVVCASFSGAQGMYHFGQPKGPGIGGVTRWLITVATALVPFALDAPGMPTIGERLAQILPKK